MSDDANPMLGTVRVFLADLGWKFDDIGDERSLVCPFTGENGSWHTYVHTSLPDESRQLLVIYSVLNNDVPERVQSDVSDLLTRINFSRPVGSFELGLGGGELRYRTSVDLTETPESLTPALFRNLLYLNVWEIDHYYPALMAIVHGGRSSEEAIDMLEDPRRA